MSVCWMMTPNDERLDGSSVQYLMQPKYWRYHDPHLYDFLQDAVIVRNNRNVKLIEQSGLLQNATFFPDLVPEDRHKRKSYFSNLYMVASKSNLVFFDPDNGIEVKSRPYGRKGSSKYLYWTELVDTFSKGYSVLVYQHFPRSDRRKFIDKLSFELKSMVSGCNLHFFYTARVLFILLATDEYEDFFKICTKEWETKWGINKAIRSDESNNWHQLSFDYQ